MKEQTDLIKKIELVDGFGNISTITFRFEDSSEWIYGKWVADNGKEKSFRPYFNFTNGPYDGTFEEFLNEYALPTIRKEVAFKITKIN